MPSVRQTGRGGSTLRTDFAGAAYLDCSFAADDGIGNVGRGGCGMTREIHVRAVDCGNGDFLVA